MKDEHRQIDLSIPENVLASVNIPFSTLAQTKVETDLENSRLLHPRTKNDESKSVSNFPTDNEEGKAFIDNFFQQEVLFGTENDNIMKEFPPITFQSRSDFGFGTQLDGTSNFKNHQYDHPNLQSRTTLKNASLHMSTEDVPVAELSD